MGGNGVLFLLRGVVIALCKGKILCCVVMGNVSIIFYTPNDAVLISCCSMF